jgi:hypothetical protein
MVSPFWSGGGFNNDGAGELNGMDGTLSIGAIDCSAGYASNDSIIVVYQSA